ncbi:MAG: hypothetical protein AB7P49_14405, partial [Bdellovibrionales bacterium]
MSRWVMFESMPWKIESSLDRFFRNGEPQMEIVGTDSLTLLGGVLTLPKVALNEKPHLVLVADEAAVQKLVTSLRFLTPEAHPYVLPAFDVGVYSGLHPNRRALARRLRWLWRAHNARPGDIFVASVEAWVQRTLPYSTLSKNAFSFRRGDEIPADLSAWLEARGYVHVPIVEDVGTFAVRGGIVDVFSPAHDHPVRLELFGDIIESLRSFDEDSQLRLDELDVLEVIPAQEILFDDENRQAAAARFRRSFDGRPVDREEAQALLHQLAQGQYFHGIEFLLAYFYSTPGLPVEHFNSPLNVWRVDPFAVTRAFDQLVGDSKKEFDISEGQIIRPLFAEVYSTLEAADVPPGSQSITLTKVRVEDSARPVALLPVSTSDLKEVATTAKTMAAHASELSEFLRRKIQEWKTLGYAVFFAVSTQAQAQRLNLLLEKSDLHPILVGDGTYSWQQWLEEQRARTECIHIIERPLGESLRYTEEHLVFLREEDVFGGKRARAEYKSSGSLEKRAHAFNFGDLKPGDL